MNENLQNRIENLLKGGSAHDLKVIEYGIDFNVVRQYWRLITKNREKLGQEELNERAENILTLPSEDQKELLAQLGKSGTVPSYRAIEKYMNDVDNEEMGKWAVVALQHCRIHVENDLLDEPIGFIATGLGGKGMKIRYYFVLASHEPLRQVMIDEVEANYREIVKEFDAEIEEVTQLDNYISVRILCPIRVKLREVVERGLENYPFLKEDYIATNMTKPNMKMIDRWEKGQLTKGQNEDEEEESEDDTFLF